MEKIVNIFEILFIISEVIIIIITYMYSLYRYKCVMKTYEDQQNEKPNITIKSFNTKTPVIVSNMTEQIDTKKVNDGLSYPFLIFNLHGIEIKKIPLNQDTTYIGRSKNDDIMINESTISRSQCIITKDDSGYFINIGRRTNPVYINGEEVITEETELFDGDKVSFGNGRISFIFVISTNIPNSMRA